MFAQDNIVSMLTSGNGPRPRRLVEYLKRKMTIDVGIEPVVTQNLDQVLRDMRMSSIDVAIPLGRITRDLVGGDWVQALDGARALAHDGVVRVGVSVGRRGNEAHKRNIRDRIRQLVNDLRGSGHLSEFDSARVSGTINGTHRSLDLMEDRFVEQTDVDPDQLKDPARSTRYAARLLRQSLDKNEEYLMSVVPPVGDRPLNYPDVLIETRDDEN